MKKALVFGHTGGIGKEIAVQLTDRGYGVLGVSRSTHQFDFENIGKVEETLSEIHGVFDAIFVATGVLNGAGFPPEKTIKTIDAEAMAAQFLINTIGPSIILKHLPRLMRKDGAAHFGMLSARVGSIGDNHLGGWISYRAAKAALNQAIKTAAIELRRTHPKAVVLALHPGTVETPFTENYRVNHETISAQCAAKGLIDTLLSVSSENSGSFKNWKGEGIPW